MIFRDRITIQQDNSDAGDPDPDFSDPPLAADIPARVISTSGDETFRGRQIEAHISYVIEMHYRDDVQPDMRVLVDSGAYKSALLNVEYVKQIPYTDGKPPQTWLYCRELVTV